VLASIGSVDHAYSQCLAEPLVDSLKTELIAERI
jgi:hypothetical protein